MSALSFRDPIYQAHRSDVGDAASFEINILQPHILRLLQAKDKQDVLATIRQLITLGVDGILLVCRGGLRIPTQPRATEIVSPSAGYGNIYSFMALVAPCPHYQPTGI